MGRFPLAARQQFLPFQIQLTPRAWQQALGAVLQRQVRVTYGRSRTLPVQVRSTQGEIMVVRLHEFFTAAPPAIVEALGSWIRSGRRARRASDLLDSWIAQQSARTAPALVLHPQGAVYDLSALRDEVIAAHVPELAAQPAPITWGSRRRSRCRHSLQLGTFDPDGGVVRIHPVLDHASVPGYFVRFVVFHELLHAVVPTTESTTGRSAHHPPAFRSRERMHPDYAQSVAWEERHLPALMRRARRGFDS